MYGSDDSAAHLIKMGRSGGLRETISLILCVVSTQVSSVTVASFSGDFEMVVERWDVPYNVRLSIIAIIFDGGKLRGNCNDSCTKFKVKLFLILY